MAERLLNKVAVVTGAGSGIGRAVAVRFLNEGARVVVFGRSADRLEEVASLAPARVLVVMGDVTRTEDLDQLARVTGRRFGSVDVVVAAAGIARFAPFVECTKESISEQFDVNFTGALETARVLLPSLNAQAAIVFVTGSLSQWGQPGLGAYSASKAALASLAGSLSVELAPRRIRVNCVAPGPVETAFWTHLGLPAARLRKLTNQFKERLLDGRFGTADDVAETITFLASDAARNIRGQEIVCDGGSAIG